MVTPRFSPQFIEVCLHKDLSPGDPMPCPRCGSPEIKYRTPRLWRQAGLGLGVASAISFLLRQIPAGLFIGALCVIAFLVSLMDEPRCVCGHCEHSWRHQDVVKWTKAIRHDLAGNA